MPFTPLHMGPGMAVKAACPRHFSIIVFGLTQIVIDSEILWHLARQDYPLHAFWHTYFGATVLAALLTILGKPASQWLKAAWNWFALKCRQENLTVLTHTGWLASCTGAFFGAIVTSFWTASHTRTSSRCSHFPRSTIFTASPIRTVLH